MFATSILPMSFEASASLSSRLPLSIGTDVICSQTIPYNVQSLSVRTKSTLQDQMWRRTVVARTLAVPAFEIEFQNSPSTVGGAV